MKPLGTPRDAIRPNEFFVEAIVYSATGTKLDFCPFWTGRNILISAVSHSGSRIFETPGGLPGVSKISICLFCQGFLYSRPSQKGRSRTKDCCKINHPPSGPSGSVGAGPEGR